jgi:hypothetical protein
LPKIEIGVGPKSNKGERQQSITNIKYQPTDHIILLKPKIEIGVGP